MKRDRLTPDRIRRFTCPADQKQAFLHDTECPHLFVRATVGGARSFVFESKLNRQTIRCTIGDVGDWTIDGARDEARRLRTLIDRGIDPRIEKVELANAVAAKRDEQRRRGVPATEAWQKYISARTAKWSARHLADHLSMIKPGGKPRTRGRRETDPKETLPGALLPLLTLRLEEIDADRVREWLRAEIARRPTQAALAYRLLRAFLRWSLRQAEYRDQVHADACNADLAREELPKKRAKKDCLQREQLKAWFEAVRAIGNPTIAAYLQVLLLTGARREELAGLKWADVDFRWNGLQIADKVEEDGREIPLTPFVASLLRNLKRRNDIPPLRRIRKDQDADNPKWRPSVWVFASPTAKSGRIEEPRIAHVRALRVAGIDGLTLHGLRRSFSTLTEWVECPAGVVAQIMGHKPSATAEKHYKQRPLDLLRLWHVRIEQWMLAEAGIQFAAEQDKHDTELQAVA